MKTSKVIIIASAVFAVLSFASCGVTTKVHVTTDQAANFYNYHSFGWLTDKLPNNGINTSYNNEIIRSNIRRYATQDLQTEGYTLNNDAPDVWLELQINDRPVQEISRNSGYPYSPYGYGSGLGSRLVFIGRRAVLMPSIGLGYGSYGGYSSPSSVRRYDQSHLTINIIDRATNHLIGSVVGITDADNPTQFNKHLQVAVAKIVKKSPLARAS